MAKKIQTPDTKESADDIRVADFFVQTGALKSHDGDGERPTVKATASSDSIDLEADRFTASALRQMKEGFAGKLIFLNHQYKVPDDVFGVVQKAELVKRDGRLDLDMDIGVEMNNPRAVQTYQYIVNGTRLGVSVGVIVTDAEKSEDEDVYGTPIFDIKGVIPLEASVVGIPANQTAWTRQAMKSLYARGAVILDEAAVEARPWLKTVIRANTAIEEDEVMGKKPKKDEDEIEDSSTEDEIEDSDTEEVEDSDTEETEVESETDDAEPDETEGRHKPRKEEGNDSEESEEESEEVETENDPDDTKGEEPEEVTADFIDEINADEAADLLIDKLFTGLYVALNSLIKILMNTDVGVAERDKEGSDVIKEWTAFIGDTWSNTIEHLNEKELEDDAAETYSVANRLHTRLADEGVDCGLASLEAVNEKVANITEVALDIAESNAKLKEELEQKVNGLKLMEQVMEELMKLPLPTVTTRTDEVAQSLAAKFPMLDDRVVARMNRFTRSQ